MSVQEYAASEMRYLCAAEDPGVGYSQPARWSWYERCDNAGWLTSDADGDCSSMVAGCYNIAFHNELGSPYTRDGTGGMFPVSNQTWTGAIPALAAGRGFVDRGDSWVSSTPAGGFRVGDLLMADGHVAMAVRDADGSFDGRDPLLAEAWIDSHGSDGWDDPDEPVGDQDGGETRLIRYADHPFTQRASWTTVLSFEGAPVASRPESGSAAVLNGIDISAYQTDIDIAAVNPDFVIVKVTEGVDYVNPAWKDQIRQAYDQNRPIGVYHYVDGSGAAAEADHFVSTVADWNGYVMWCVDWEQGDNSAWGSTAYLTEFIEAVKARNGGKWIMLYASAAVYPHDVAAACNTGKWIAQYADMNPHGWDDAPWTDGTWTARIHQYTGTGRVAGYGGDLDLDLFHGTADDFRAYYKAPVPTIITDRISLLEGADDMRVTHVLFAYEGTMYLYCVLSHTYTPIPDPGTLEDVKFILARAGARVEDWLEFNRGSSLEVGNLKAFGRFVPLDG